MGMASTHTDTTLTDSTLTDHIVVLVEATIEAVEESGGGAEPAQAGASWQGGRHRIWIPDQALWTVLTAPPAIRWSAPSEVVDTMVIDPESGR
jgi:hypothetical protein